MFFVFFIGGGGGGGRGFQWNNDREIGILRSHLNSLHRKYETVNSSLTGDAASSH